MKVLGALNSSKGITNHLYSPFLVLNIFFHSSLGWILIWWYPLLRSISENIVAPYIKSSISSRRRMGNDTWQWFCWLRDYSHTYVTCHSSLMPKVHELHMDSSSLWWIFCQVIFLLAIVILCARQDLSCNGESLAKLFLELTQWHVKCLTLKATHLTYLLGGLQKIFSVLV